MLALTSVVAIAVSCSVVFLVSAVVITIVWVKIRQERVSLTIARHRQGRYAHGLQSFPAETLTELSREEGTALRQYGQLPYGKPNEWGLLTSRESLILPVGDIKTPIPLVEKPRSFSLSSSKSKSKRQSKALLLPKYPSPLTTLTETTESSPSSKMSISKDEMPISAVDGALELPTEITPRQTPEREDEQPPAPPADATIRPFSGVWPLIHQRERSGSLFPVLEDHYESFGPGSARVRGGSIASQTAGSMPEQPVPPPPCAYPPNRFRLSKNDSMRLSSLSLETADSSILDDSRRTSTILEGSLTSPALPPCPTFVPFSANDVGREYDRKNFSTANAAQSAFTFPSSPPTFEGQRLESERASPRRSLTARSPTHSMERIGPPPRRSESLYTKQTRGNASPLPYLDLNRIPPLNTVGRNAALLPHFSQLQRHSLHGSPRRANDPFYSGTATSQSLTSNSHGPGRRASSFFWQETALQTSNIQSKPPLTSALKGGSGPRKGHRRQNCVRISIHPPITFGGPAFSPMVEEPEEQDDLDPRRSEISDLSASNISRNSSVSAMSMSRSSLQDSQRDRPSSRIVEASNEGQAGACSSPAKKRKQMQPDTTMGMEKTLPEILTCLPTTVDEGTLSHTPSPAKTPTVWMVPDYDTSPTRIENSPRRSIVMGPRSQPGKPARNNCQSLISREEDMEPLRRLDRPPRNPSLKNPSPKPVDTLRRVKSEARDPPPPRYQASKKRASHCDKASSTIWCSPKAAGPPNGVIVPIWEDKNMKPPATRRSTVSLASGPAELHGDTSPQAIERPKSRNQAERMSRMSSYKKSRQSVTTPTRKTVGLGIGAATPGSLYDGDGFLKE
ncbi:hypothetical protein AOCH_002228 [Aspergillus ochraceoroseus]|nr:hypothetical protein AOCH_002228 [Aspergillus ochraceoroseus]